MKRSLWALIACGAFVVVMAVGQESSVAATAGDTIQSAPQAAVTIPGDASDVLELGDKRCYQCSKGSTGKCKRNSNSYARCWGTKKECKAKGCKGMSSSSSSCKGYGANVPRC